MPKNPETETACLPLIEAEITRCPPLEETGNSQIFFHLVADPRKKEYTLHIPLEFKETALVIEMLLHQKPDRIVRANFLHMDCHQHGFAVPNPRSGSTSQIPLIVLEPHWLINVTTLTNFDFCQRNYFLERYMLKTQTPPMMRGTFVHEVFDHIVQSKSNVPGLRRECSSSLTDHALDLAFLGISPSELYDDAKNHLNGLFKGLKYQNVLDMNADRGNLSGKIYHQSPYRAQRQNRSHFEAQGWTETGHRVKDFKAVGKGRKARPYASSACLPPPDDGEGRRAIGAAHGHLFRRSRKKSFQWREDPARFLELPVPGGPFQQI